MKRHGRDWTRLDMRDRAQIGRFVLRRLRRSHPFGRHAPLPRASRASRRRCALHPDRPQGVHRRTDTWRCSESEHNQRPEPKDRSWGTSRETLGNQISRESNTISYNIIPYHTISIDIQPRKSRELSAHNSFFTKLLAFLDFSMDPQISPTCDL